MILQRFATALKNQDWTVVFIEFLLVVTGVLVALEVDRYSEEQKKKVEELEYLAALERDIKRDIIALDAVNEDYIAIKAFAGSAYTALNRDGCSDDMCWQHLVELFHASQWRDSTLNEATYTEMRRSGLPSNALLKERLEGYYDMSRSQGILINQLPHYRTLARSLIPPDIQDYMWENCFTISGTDETYNIDCISPVNAASARSILSTLQTSPDVKQALTYWISTLALTELTAPMQVERAEEMLATIQNVVETGF